MNNPGYEVLDRDLDPNGTEVYSRLGSRRMRGALGRPVRADE
jgi:hypothetical protein